MKCKEDKQLDIILNINNYDCCLSFETQRAVIATVVATVWRDMDVAAISVLSDRFRGRMAFKKF